MIIIIIIRQKTVGHQSVPIIIDALGKVLVENLKIRGRVETIQITGLLRPARILKKSPGDLRRLAVTQTPVRNHRLTLV